MSDAVSPSNRPEYHLRRVQADGQLGPVEIYPLHAPPLDAAMGRRRFLGTGVSVGAAVAALDRARQARGQEAPLQPAQVVFAHRKAVRALAFSPDSRLLCSASQDGTAKVWDLDAGSLLHSLLHEDSVNALSLSSEGSLLATACADQVVRLWSTADGSLQQLLAGHTASVDAVAASPASDLLASGSVDGSVRLWSLATGAEQGVIATGHGAVRDLAISPAGDLLVTVGRDAVVRQWSLPDGALMHEGEGHTHWLNAVAIGRDEWIAAAGADRKISLRSRAAPGEVRTFTAHEDIVGDVCFSADGAQLASVGKDARVALWRVSDGAHAEMPCPFPCVAAAFSPDGSVLATGDVNGAIILWNARTRKLMGFLFDPRISATDAVLYRVVNRFTQVRVTYALPFGWPAPAGAVCVIERVPGELNLVADDWSQETIEETKEELIEESATDRPASRLPKKKPRETIQVEEQYIETPVEENPEVTRAPRLTVEERRQRLRELREQRALDRQMRYQWQYDQTPSYGGGGTTWVCTCDTISY